MSILRSFFTKGPWPWVILAFLLVITAWTLLIRLAARHTPEVIDVPSPRHSEAQAADPAPEP